MSVLSDEILRLEQQRQEFLDRAAAARSEAQRTLEQGDRVLTDQAKQELQERSQRLAEFYEGCAERIDEQVKAVKSLEQALQREEGPLQTGFSDPEALKREFEQLKESAEKAAAWAETQRQANLQEGMSLAQDVRMSQWSALEQTHKEVHTPDSSSFFMKAPESLDPVTASAIGGAVLIEQGKEAISTARESLAAALDQLAHEATERLGRVADLLELTKTTHELSEQHLNRLLEESAKQPETLENKVLELSAEHDKERFELANQSKELQKEEQTLQRQLELAEQGRDNFIKRQEQMNVEPEKYQEQLAKLDERVEEARQRLQEFQEMSAKAQEEYARQQEEMRQRHQRQLEELQR